MNVCIRLADQLMLFQAQVPGSEIISGPVTNHIKTNTKNNSTNTSITNKNEEYEYEYE